MTQLLKYDDFLSRVDSLGFMSLSSILPGFPSLSDETAEENWHTGDPETDPWVWKDRAAKEKRLAFGCILGGHKGFVSADMYSLFYTAFHPYEHIEERRASGEVSETVWKLWQIFEEKTLLNTSDIRREMGVTLKKGGSKVDKAIEELQQYYYITVSGSRQKIDKYGKPYGWPANVYDKVENWVPSEWMKLDTDISPEYAREIILDKAVSISQNVSRKELAKVLGIKPRKSF
ncbi:hypothetical protein [Sedimentibacter sp.]|uniref:AlkZ-related protein n=1 Tax=Sedimentibacter sp. TaxID=1960295 RepID=UPI0028AA06EF|nr:hypothetical protein [Sedimentibacter sp.]